MNTSKGLLAMASSRRVTVSSMFNIGVWIGVVKVDGAIRWCSSFAATRSQARDLAKPIADDVRAALRANRPISLPAPPYAVIAQITKLRGKWHRKVS